MAMTVRLTVDGVSRDLRLALSVAETEECERLTGWSKPEWLRELGRGRGRALAYAWWLASQRDGNPLPGAFADVDFLIDDDFLEIVDTGRPERLPPDEDTEGPTGPGPEDTTRPGN